LNATLAKKDDLIKQQQSQVEALKSQSAESKTAFMATVHAKDEEISKLKQEH
jgi:hypothetical protein